MSGTSPVRDWDLHYEAEARHVQARTNYPRAVSARYSFLTTWLIEAPRERVWETLDDVLTWPEWWRGVTRVEQLDPGDDRGVGGRHSIEWRARLPYPLEFEFVTDRVERPRLMAGRAFGELEGSGCWRLYEEDGITAVTYDWRVGTTKRWMNLLAPVAKPAFVLNHDWVMRQGGEGLARRLGGRLIAHS